MADITNMPTDGSLTVNGDTQASDAISWSKPIVPSEATINSNCTVTSISEDIEPEIKQLSLGNLKIDKLFLGVIPIKKIYLGDNLVFSKRSEHSPAAEIKTGNIAYDIGTETVFDEDEDYIDTGVDLFEPNSNWSVLIDFDDRGHAESSNSLFILHNFYEGPNGELQGFNIQKTGTVQGHRLSFQVNDKYYKTKPLEDGTNTRLVITFENPGTLKMYYNDPDIDQYLNGNGCFQFNFGEFHDIEGCNLHLACWYNESQGGVGRFWRGTINEFTAWTGTALTEQEALYVLNNKKEDTLAINIRRE